MRVLFIYNTPIAGVVPVNIYENYGFHVDVFRYSNQSDWLLSCVPYCAVVFMTEAPDCNVVKHWRKNGISVPVIVISKPSAVSVRLACLKSGADDWLPAPVAPEEVTARIRAILRRNHAISDVLLRHGELVFDPVARTVTIRGEPIKLTAREMTVLELLLLHHPRILTRR